MNRLHVDSHRKSRLLHLLKWPYFFYQMLQTVPVIYKNYYICCGRYKVKTVNTWLYNFFTCTLLFYFENEVYLFLSYIKKRTHNTLCVVVYFYITHFFTVRIRLDTFAWFYSNLPLNINAQFNFHNVVKKKQTAYILSNK